MGSSNLDENAILLDDFTKETGGSEEQFFKTNNR
jgi:hypothetical protein